MMRVCLLIAFVIGSIVYGKAQEPVWQQYTAGAGLPSNMIYDIYRDGEGYLWFATDKGICRYNGLQFETYATIHGLPDNEIFFFKQDYQQRLWISTFNGELCYYKDGKFFTAANTPFLKLSIPTYDTKFITLHPDSSISIYFSNQQTHFINIKNEKLKTIDISALNFYTSAPFIASAILKPGPGIYDVFVGKYKIRINEQSSILKVDTTISNSSYYKTSYTQDSVYLFDDHAIYDLYQHILYRFPGKAPEQIIRVYFKDGKPVLGTNTGLVLDNKLVLKEERISSVTQDLNGNLWIGTLGHGVFKLKKNYTKYTSHHAAYQGTVSYSYNTAEGMLFATSANRLYMLPYATGSSPRLLDSLPLSYESSQYIDSNMFYTCNGRQLQTSVHNKYFQKQRKGYDLGMTLIAKTLIVDGSTAYMHFQGKIIRFNNKTRKQLGFTHRPESRIFYMSKDAKGAIWYTTKYMYQLQGNRAVHQPQFNGLSFKWFKFFGNNFVGVTHAGRLIISKTAEDKKLKYSIVHDDCKWGNAYAIDSAHILLTTDGPYRLMTIYPSSADTVRFSMKVIDNEFVPEGAEHITAKDSNIYFFSQGNIYLLPIREFLLAPGRPQIAGIMLQTSKGHYNSRNPVYLSHTEAANIQITIRSLSFDSKNLFYRYSIAQGAGDNWNTTKNPEINLVAPGYGQYLVKIKAVTRSGAESRTYIVNITVLKPFYLQWWFLIAITISLCILIILAVRIRIKYLLSQREKEYGLKMKVLKSEYKALNALMNPHFIFNSLNSIQGFINKGNKELANMYLHLFSRLMRQNMHNISRELVTLSEETELVKNYLLLEKMRFNDRFEYSIDVEDGIEDTDIFIPPLLIQPLVENAIKHGLLPRHDHYNTLSIRIHLRDSRLMIIVEDNGIGFPSANEAAERNKHKSYALSNIYSRIGQLNELHGNVIYLHIESPGANMGTKITIELDINTLGNTAKDRY